MADSANGKGGKAPRTLFSLGRGGDGKRSKGAQTATLESYPPADPDAPEFEPTDEDVTIDAAMPTDESGTDESGTEPVAEADASVCPSCGESLVQDAAFCGECGTRVTPVEAAATTAAAASAASSNGSDSYVPAHADPDDLEAPGGLSVDDLLEEPPEDPDDASGRGAFATFVGGAAAVGATAVGAEAVADHVSDHDESHADDSAADEPESEPDEAVAETEPEPEPEPDEAVAETEPETADEPESESEPDEAVAETEPEPEPEPEPDEAVAETEPETESETESETEADEAGSGHGAEVAAAGVAVPAAVALDEHSETAAITSTAGSGKRTGLILAGVAAVIVLLVVGVVALGGGSSNKVKTAAADNSNNTATTAEASTTTSEASTSTSEASTSTSGDVTTTTQAATTTTQANTTTTARPVTPTTAPVTVTLQPPPLTPASLTGTCPSSGRGSAVITLHNGGGQAGQFHLTTNNSRVSLSPASGSVPGNTSISVSVVSSGFDGVVFVSGLLAGNAGGYYCSISI